MRSLGGLVLLAGVSVGLFVYLPAPVDRSTTLKHALAVFADNTTRNAADKQALAPQRTFSPGISLADLAKPVRIDSAHRTMSDEQVQLTAGTQGWNAVVTASPAAAGSLAPANPSSRYELIVEIQKQLKRVGCYWGRTDGSWGSSTKYAMQSFTERVNAALPIDDPDYLLLTLLQAQSGRTCDQQCPAGLEMSANGRCVAQVAQARPAETLPWKAAAAQTQPAQAKAPGTPLFTPIASSVVSSAPLPGRMAIGGPRVLPPVDAANGADITTVEGGTNRGAATAALDPAAGGPPPQASSPPKRRSSSYSSNRGRGTGTSDAIRRNLLTSLGGQY
jgi:hypothetical protein